MNATISRTALLAALTSASKVVETKPTQPILGMVLFAFTPSELALSAQNPACHIALTVEASASGPHSYCIDPAPLLAALTQAGGESVTMETDGDGRVKVACGAARYRLNVLDAAEYPSPVPVGEGATIAIGGPALGSLLARVAPSIAPEGNKYGLCGVFMEHSAETGLRLVSTDANRLTYDEAPATINGGLPRRGLIPVAVVKMIAMLAGLTAGDVSLVIEERSIQATAPGVTIIGRMLEADFPDYRSVLPTGSGKGMAVFNVADLMRAVKSVAPLAGGESKDVTFALSSDGLTLKSAKVDAGSAEVACPCEWNGEPIAFGMNATFIVTLLSVVAGDRVTVDVFGALMPTIWRDGGVGRFVLMPLRLS